MKRVQREEEEEEFVKKAKVSDAEDEDEEEKIRECVMVHYINGKQKKSQEFKIEFSRESYDIESSCQYEGLWDIFESKAEEGWRMSEKIFPYPERELDENESIDIYC